MLNGIGSITLRSGRKLSAKYQFSTHQDRHWTGYLIVDSEYIDPSEFGYKILLHCADGGAVELAITNWTNQYMAVVGRPIPEFDQAPKKVEAPTRVRARTFLWYSPSGWPV
jgi:hypothetical protein